MGGGLQGFQLLDYIQTFTTFIQHFLNAAGLTFDTVETLDKFWRVLHNYW
jgi:hypothetical protein